jgi:hypothetical protein
MTKETTMIQNIAILGLTFALGACSATKRGPELYRTDTQTVLETRNTQLERCYDEVLASDASAAGTVAVQFVVAKKSGAFGQVAVDPARSTAPEPLVRCVIDAMQGLALQPGDASEGRATFVYRFEPRAAS